MYAKKNNEYLKSFPENNRATFVSFINRVEKETNYFVEITSGNRSNSEQAKLHSLNPKNAKPGASPHNQFRAIDLNLVHKKTGERIVKVDSAEKWGKTGIVFIARGMGLKWGGDSYKNYHDPVHFEIPKTFYEKTKEVLGNVGTPVLVFAVLIVAAIVFIYSQNLI